MIKSKSISFMKMILALTFTIFLACNSKSKTKKDAQNAGNQIVCNEWVCFGAYYGKEFIDGSDLAHQYSNKMSAAVGDQLKELYDLKKYSKVDFPKIEMSTEGMGSGIVEYKLKIPFVSVSNRCDSYTSFDHVGGWNHSPELEKRKNQLQKALMKGDKLDMSELKTTKEGLQEYWIQWRNKHKQMDCLNTSQN